MGVSCWFQNKEDSEKSNFSISIIHNGAGETWSPNYLRISTSKNKLSRRKLNWILSYWDLNEIVIQNIQFKLKFPSSAKLVLKSFTTTRFAFSEFRLRKAEIQNVYST